MKHLRIVMMLMAGLMLISLPVSAEEIVITHRSGKVQVIEVDGSVDPIDSVALRLSGKNNLPTPPPTTEGAVPPQTQDKAKVSGKPSVKYKWVKPMDPQ
jgi:hypothetical protein